MISNKLDQLADSATQKVYDKKGRMFPQTPIEAYCYKKAWIDGYNFLKTSIKTSKRKKW